MLLQIKCIRKGSKPAIWRRALVPIDITFSQLAYILEIILEMPQTARFEFDFFQEKDRLVEADGTETFPVSYDYTYRSSRDYIVNDYFQTKTWFTFRMRDQAEVQPEYRIECEKLAEAVSTEVKDREPVLCPVIIKAVLPVDDLYWTDTDKINRKLQEACFLTEGTQEYLPFSDVCDQAEQRRGIIFNKDAKSRDHILRQSTRSLLKELSDRIGTIIKEDPSGALAASLDEKLDIVRKFQKTSSIEDILRSFTKADLKEIAFDAGCKLAASAKPKMAYELARYLLKPDVMRMRMLRLTEEELSAFEKAADKGRFLPSAKEKGRYDTAVYLTYMGEYTDDTVEVPEDSAAVYRVLKKTGYREFHRKGRWLLDCLHTFALIHVVGNEDLVFQMYIRAEDFSADRAEFEEIFEKLPEEINPCRKVGRRIVALGAVKDDIYKRIEANQRNVPYYIPTKQEINEYSQHGYPVSNSAYRELYEFYAGRMKLDQETCEKLTMSAFGVFSGGGMLSDYMEELNERELVFGSDRQVREFANIVMNLNNSTRMFILKGHTPNEMSQFSGGTVNKGRPTIIPMSSMAADMLNESRGQLEAMGFKADLDASADHFPVFSYPEGMGGDVKTAVKKIYPNDPCPCGSGKKYKKCCGRK